MSALAQACTRLRPRTRGALAGVGASMALLAVAGPVVQQRLGLGGLFVAKLLAAHGLAALVLLSRLHARWPFAGFGAANHVTLGRLALVAVLIALLGEGDGSRIAWLATALALVVLALDGVDGWLARRSGTACAFGARFDMETDALLILALSALAWQLDRAGPWVLLSGLMRYLFVGAGLVLPWLRRALPASRRRQAACALQASMLVICLAPVVAAPWSAAAAAAGLLLLGASFAVDITWLARRAHLPMQEVET